MKPIATVPEAEQAVAEITALMERLAGVLEQETRLVHAGKVRGAAALAAPKAELAGRLFAVVRTFQSQREISATIGADTVRGAACGCRKASAPFCRRT